MIRSRFALPCSAILAALTFALPLHAADEPPPRSDEQILKALKLPDGYEATVFAKPPQLGYPTSVSAAIDGTLFIAIDENGSLGRDRNSSERPRGKVVRLRDTDGDGKADEFKTFAEMESPRGVIWDGPSGTAPGTLYVMAPPKLTAFTDTDGDGTADKQEDIVTGLGFGLDFRGADHTTNGCRLAIDGFIYIAVGDYGFTKAVAKDGTTLSMRGGGIVRVRPDGTGFEIVSRGQRNIYDVAISPTLDLFTRDNTNDGGGWNVRLSHVPPGAHMGYPTLFKNFPEDMVPALADFGGGSPCGALWIDEPGLPGGLFTVEWGSNAIMHHPLKAKGAGWELDPAGATDPKLPGQVKWLGITRPTDMDVDAAGRIYITSWEGATFTYNGPNAGYVVRVVKKGAPAASVPDLGKMTGRQLGEVLSSRSAALRLAAQRQLLHRGLPRLAALRANKALGVTTSDLSSTAPIKTEQKVGTGDRPNYYDLFHAAISDEPAGFRAAVIWTLSLLHADVPVEGRAGDAQPVAIAAFAAEHGSVASPTPIDALADHDPRVRAAAITALRRLGLTDAAGDILPLVADQDPIVAHLAIGALRELKAVDVCLAALDGDAARNEESPAGAPKTAGGALALPDDSADERVKPGALQALYGIHDPAVVEGLIARLGSVKGKDRRGILNALCRLAMQDAPYLDPKEWWGTRPDTSGPVYKPVRWAESAKIEAALAKEAERATGEEARWLIGRMVLAKVNVPGLIEKLLALCGNDTPARLTAVEGLFRPDHSLPAEAVAALASTAASGTETPDLRARALRLLQRGSEHGSVFPAAVAAFAPLAGHDLGHAALTAAFEDFTHDAKHTKWISEHAKLVAGADAAKRTLAQTVLVNLATSALVKGKDKEKAERAVAQAWETPESAASLLGVIARTKARTYAAQVDARLKDPNNAVAEAALFAHQSLGLGDAAPAQQLGAMKYEAALAAVAKGGDVAQGQEVYLRAGCIACHTIGAEEPVKGPVLSAVAKIYDRAALAESILKPNAKLAQGFESVWVKTKKGEQVEGFITREGGDSLDVRNIVGQTVTLEKGDIAERGQREISMMPEGLMNTFTSAELASLLAYLESLKTK